MARTSKSTTKDTAAVASKTQVQTPEVVAKLQAVERDLDSLLIERSEPIRATMVAILARQHLVQLGAPGAAKSMLIEQAAKRFTPATGDGLSTFVWQMNKFTKPEELFGPYSIKGLKNDEYRRITTGKAPEAQLMFLDEPFKGTSAILNTLLLLMNERQFDNGSMHKPDGTLSVARMDCPLITLMGASNEMPEGADSGAIWDRFALRLTVSYVSDANFVRMLKMQNVAPMATMTEAELFEAQKLASNLPIPDSLYNALGQLRKDLAAKGIIASDRRWKWMPGILQAHALLDGKMSVDEDDLIMLKHAMWSKPEEEKEIGRIAARLANPINAKAVELADQANGIFDSYTSVSRGAAAETVMNAALEAITKLKKINEEMDKLVEHAQREGRSTARVERSLTQVRVMRKELGTILVGA
jgi:MoxR-like ATPase